MKEQVLGITLSGLIILEVYTFTDFNTFIQDFKRPGSSLTV